MKTLLRFSLLSFILLFAACSKDDNKKGGSTNQGDWDNLIVTTIPNPDGLTGSTYMQLMGEFVPSSYDNSKAIPTPFMALPYIYGKDVYVLPAWDSQQEVVKYSLVKGVGLQKQGTLVVPPSSGATSVAIKSADKAYLALAFLGKIVIFNPTTMVKTGEIDITEYGLDDKNPDPGAMLIRDGLLFVGLNQMVGGYVPKYKSADVLVINTESDKVEKLIRDEASGLSTATRPIDQRSIFMDEKEDIYVVCYSGFGFAEGHKAGILRIKKGTTEFDAAYTWNLTEQEIAGNSNKMDWLHWVQYTRNGKLYAIANLPVYHSSPRDYVKDRTAVPVELDLYNKTVKTISLPRSTSWGTIGLLGDLLIYGLNGEDNGFYTFDPVSGEGSKSPIVKIVGRPQMFHHFGK